MLWRISLNFSIYIVDCYWLRRWRFHQVKVWNVEIFIANLCDYFSFFFNVNFWCHHNRTKPKISFKKNLEIQFSSVSYIIYILLFRFISFLVNVKWNFRNSLPWNLYTFQRFLIKTTTHEQQNSTEMRDIIRSSKIRNLWTELRKNNVWLWNWLPLLFCYLSRDRQSLNFKKNCLHKIFKTFRRFLFRVVIRWRMLKVESDNWLWYVYFCITTLLYMLLKIDCWEFLALPN